MRKIIFIVLSTLVMVEASHADLGCRVSGSAVDTAGNNGNMVSLQVQAGANTAAQPQPKGQIVVNQLRGPAGMFTFQAGTASAPPGTEVDMISCSEPGFCSGRPAPAKKIEVEGIGVFRNIGGNGSAASAENESFDGTYHWIELELWDLDEPGMVAADGAECPPEGPGTDPANCDCPDFYRVKIYEGFVPSDALSTDGGVVIYEESGYIDGGNLQIHPPTGFDRN